MSTDIKDLLNPLLPDGNSLDKPIKQLPIDAVDRIADSLVKEYENPGFRPWYCGVIYQFGFPQVQEWRRRAEDGRETAKLFCKYVKDARTYKQHTGFGDDKL